MSKSIKELVAKNLARREKNAKSDSYPPSKAEKVLKKAIDEMNALRDGERWSEATPKHLVAFYADTYEVVYGFSDPDMRTKSFLFATAAATKLLSGEFKGDAELMARYVSYAWQKEMKFEKARQAGTNQSEFRLSWKGIFIYRTHLAAFYYSRRNPKLVRP